MVVIKDSFEVESVDTDKSTNYTNRGRPRDPSIDRQILEATLAELVDRGFSRMSMQTVADRAGVTKPTIYRRWPSKPSLALAALMELNAQEPDVEDVEPRLATRRELELVRIALHDSGMLILVGTLVAESQRHPEFLATYRARVVERRRARLMSLLERAQRNGEIAPSANLETAVLLLLGFAFTNYVVSDDPLKTDTLQAAVDLIFDGLG